MKSKSPFIIIDNFLSPMECETIVDRSFFSFPNMENGIPVKSTTRNILTEELVLNYMDEIIDLIEEYYNYDHLDIIPFEIEHYPEGGKIEPIRCENSHYNGGKWLRKNDYSFTGIIFLKDDNLSTDFDDLFEVHGAKLQFHNHEFSIHPQRGQLILFPSGPNFLNSTVFPKLGDLYQIRFHMVGLVAGTDLPWEYNMELFPGDYRTWF